jgi:hypothetical protein
MATAAHDGAIHRVQFLTREQRDAFERDYLPQLGDVIGPAVDMSKLPQRAYRCDICGTWHLTSKPDRTKREYGHRTKD